GWFGFHLDGTAGAFDGAQAAALAVVVVDFVAAVAELDDRVVRADAVAVVAAEAVAAGHAAARLEQRGGLVQAAGHLVEGGDPPGRLEPGPDGGRDVGAPADVRAGRDEGGVVTRVQLGLDVGDRGVELQVDAHVQDAGDLGVQDVARQPVLRYAVAHHAAGRGARILDGDPVAKAGEVVGGGQAGRPRPYHQHPLTRRRRVNGNLPALAERLVAEEPLHRVDAY